MIHVTSCFFFFSLRKGTIAFGIFFLVNHAAWLTLNIGKFITPEGRDKLLGIERECKCIERSFNVDDSSSIFHKVQRNNESYTNGENVAMNWTAVNGYDIGTTLEQTFYDEIDVSMGSGSREVTNCPCSNEFQDAWFWSSAAVHIICSMVAIIFNMFLIYGAIKMKHGIICTCAVYSFIYWLFLLFSLSVTLTLKAMDLNTSHEDLFIGFLLSVGFLSILLHATLVMNSFRIKIKHDKSIWYSESSIYTEVDEDYKEDSSSKF